MEHFFDNPYKAVLHFLKSVPADDLYCRLIEYFARLSLLLPFRLKMIILKDLSLIQFSIYTAFHINVPNYGNAA